MFEGDGGVLWQQREQLSCGLYNNTFKVKAVASADADVLNTSQPINLANQSRIACVQKDRVVANGLALSLQAHSNTQPPANSKLHFGVFGPTTLRPLNGRIYAIRYYNRRLTDDEIIYNQRVDNVRFNLGLTLPNSVETYVPNRSITLMEEEDER